ncbi:MAG: hypothetical protein J6112_03035 [Clostridia bacterium]|nr:hypothetical protein [Clostridia bacterium]
MKRIISVFLAFALVLSLLAGEAVFSAGDADRDGEVSDWDAILLERWLAGWNVDIHLSELDIDEDGDISDWDAILLERYLAGWNVELPSDDPWLETDFPPEPSFSTWEPATEAPWTWEPATEAPWTWEPNTTGTETGTGGFETPSPVPELKAGDVVILGSYEQDNNISNGTEEIEWIVLSVDFGTATLISKYALDALPYNTVSKGVTWKTSTLRSWLNNDFYNSAFSSSEKAQIKSTNHYIEKNPDYETGSEEVVTDYVYLPGYYNMVYSGYGFSTDPDSYDDERLCSATTYARARGCIAADSGDILDVCQWWISLPGESLSAASVVSEYGFIDTCGTDVDYGGIGVRPMLCADAATLRRSEDSFKLQRGDNYVFGQIRQDADSDRKSEMMWRVVAVEKDRVLLVSEYVIDALPYDEDGDNNTWASSSLRAWLNDVFLIRSFIPYERDKICEVALHNDDNPVTGADGGDGTWDKVFILSYEELTNYLYGFSSYPNAYDSARMCTATEYAAAKGLDVVETGEYKGNCSYWVRTPGNTQSDGSLINSNGQYDSVQNDVTSVYGVRPAIWMKIN